MVDVWWWVRFKIGFSKLKDNLRRKVFGDHHSHIMVLLDSSLGWDVRDDSAVYLIDHDEPEVEDALFSVASSPTENDDIAESCGEVLAEIWCRKNKLQIESLRKLRPAALVEALAIIQARKPEWSSILQKEGFLSDES